MDNIFKELRLKHTKMKNTNKAFTQTYLAELLGISQQTVDKIEHGYAPSYNTVKVYHDYFHVPYETLFGQGGIAFEPQNISISKELGLSDQAINNIRTLSPRSLAMLDALLSNKFSNLELANLFNYLHSMDNYLQEKGHSKLDSAYVRYKYFLLEELSTYLIECTSPTLISSFKHADCNKL